MKKIIWIKNVQYFLWHLAWACIIFNKKKIKDYWWWLREYFDIKELKRDEEKKHEENKKG